MCSYTPRFSYTVSEMTVPTIPYTAPTDVPAVGTGPWVHAGWVYWVGTWVAIPGYYPATVLCSRRVL